MFKVFTRLSRMVRNLRAILSDGLSFFTAVWRRRTALAAENLFLRKQLALFREREKKAMATTLADRFVFSKLARPRLSLQIRPYIITSKAANGSDPEQHLVIACQRPSWQRRSF